MCYLIEKHTRIKNGVNVIMWADYETGEVFVTY